ILASLSTLLAEHHIGIFAVSTYNTDYILVKENQFLKTLAVLREAGHEII
ncbi:MAG: ACT domain-containing protein, partial [Clostridia bacterium]|nr:ACT domain-containing protein [Clostridia bacterium]